MSDKPSREAERAAMNIDDDESISEPTIPIADKGETGRARPAGADPADGLTRTPRPRSERAESIADDDGLVDPEPEVKTLDFTDGSMSTQTITQGESVVEAAFDDRGPATHLDPGDLDRAGAPSAAELVDRTDSDLPEPFLDEEEN